MKKMLFFIIMVSLCLFISPVVTNAASTVTENVVLKVGEQYKLKKYSKNGKIKGDSISLKKGIITGISVGNSTCTYKGKDKKKHIVNFKVENAEINVTMLDIGQGDAFLIRVNGQNIVLDTGEKKYYEYLKKQLEYFEVEHIDMLIISHMDTDHMGAAQLLLQDYGSEKVIMPVTPGNSTEYNKLMNYIDREKVETIYAHSGDEYDLGTCCKIVILGADMGEDTNDSSIVMKLVYYDNSFLFTGDASASVLNKLMEDGKNIQADVLKVAHHGSDSTNPLLFLKKTGSQYSLISVGRDNGYGHPTSNVLRRLEMLHSKVLRTDLNGTVTIKGDGKTLDYSCEQIIDWNAEEKLRVENGSIIGNVNSKVYHYQDCMSLPLEKNRVYFNSIEDAEAAGYRKCGNCVR